MGWFSSRREKPASEASSSTQKAVPEVGPFDYKDKEDEAAKMIDFGSLFVPPIPGMLVSGDVAAGTDVLIGITLHLGNSSVGLMPVAASKSGDIKKEILADIGARLEQDGYRIEVAEGEFGSEVRAFPKSADGSDMRVTGVRGPNWFLRLIYNGVAAHGGSASENLDDIIRKVVVRRDSSPRPPRDLLPLKMPIKEEPHAES